ncbi:MAG: molecular chaperone TorD family protein [Thiohalorhabdus sp.]
MLAPLPRRALPPPPRRRDRRTRRPGRAGPGPARPCERSAGRRPPPERATPPDHLALELEFMNFLAFKEHQAREEGDAAHLEGYVRAQWDFLERHLGRWVEEFGTQAGEKPSPCEGRPGRWRGSWRPRRPGRLAPSGAGEGAGNRTAGAAEGVPIGPDTPQHLAPRARIRPGRHPPQGLGGDLPRHGVLLLPPAAHQFPGPEADRRVPPLPLRG